MAISVRPSVGENLRLSRGRMILSDVDRERRERLPMYVDSHWSHDKNHASLPLCGDMYRRVIRDFDVLWVDPDLLKRFREISRKQGKVLELAKEKDAPGDPRLYPHQRVGVSWLREANRGILADDQGIGKTVQSLSAADAEWNKVLIVCSHSKMHEWADEIEVWTGLTPVVLEGDEDSRLEIFESVRTSEERVALVIGHSHTRMHSAEIERLRLDGTIYDEAHILRNRKTGAFKAARALSRVSGGMYLLTATPSVNEPSDIWSLLYLVDRSRFSSYWSFVFRFCEWKEHDFGFDIGGVESPEEQEALNRLLKVYMLRRVKGIDVDGFPERVHRKRMLKMSPEHRNLYREDLHNLLRKWGLPDDTEIFNPLEKITRNRQLATEPRVLYPEYEGSSKREAVLEEMESSDTPMLVFSKFSRIVRAMSQWLEDNGYRSEILTGDIPPGKRSDIVGRFQSGEIDALCLTYGVGGEGLNLTRAAKIVFCDLEWHSAGMRQAQERIHRYGQTADKIEVVTLLSEDTVDEYMWDIIQRKRELSIEELLSKMLEAHREGCGIRGQATDDECEPARVTGM